MKRNNAVQGQAKRFILPLVLLLFFSAAHAATLEVAAGTPLQSVFSRVADCRAVSPGETVIEVRLAPGAYPLDKAAVLPPSAGGDAGCRVVYRSADPQRPAIVTGGRRIRGWQVGADGAWRVTLPEVRDGRWNFTRLFADGVRRFRPRFPSDGYSLTVSNVIHAQTGPVKEEPGLVAGFAYEGDAIDPDWSNRADMELFNLQKWNTSRMRIGSLDAANRIVRFTAPRYCTSAHSAYRGTRFWVENVKEMFGRPGSWYLDRPTGVLSYMPCPGETPAETVIEVPVSERLLLVRGETGRAVENVVFKDIVFTLDGHSTPPEGSFAVQAAFQVPAAIELVRAREVAFEGCVMTRLGGYAVAFGPGVRDCRISDTLMRDLGAGGVKMGAPYKGYADLPTDSPQPMGETVAGFDGKAWDLTHHITVENCRVTGGGRVFPDAVGLLCLRASHNRFLHNEIDDLYYSGVSVGWDWSCLPTMSHHNEIAYNHIHGIGQRLLSDMGFVYLLGRAPGTSVHHNYLHDISVFAYGGTGIYPDESSSGVEIHHNLVRDTVRSYHQNLNGDVRNLVHDNVFLFGRILQYDLHVPATNPANVEVEFMRNVFVWRAPGKAARPGVRYPKGRAAADFEIPFGAGLLAASNVYWRTDGAAAAFGAPSACDFATWRRVTGTDVGSVYADPLIEDLPNGGIRFRPGSPALARGIGVLDVDETGPVGGAPKCAAFPDTPVAKLYRERTTSVSDGRLVLAFDETNAGFELRDSRTGAAWRADGRQAVSNVFSSVRAVSRTSANGLSFQCTANGVDGFDQRKVSLRLVFGVLVADIVREARVGWPMPGRLKDLDDIAYPYPLEPLNDAARQQTVEVVRNAVISVIP